MIDSHPLRAAPGGRALRIAHVLPAATRAGGGERVAVDLANQAAAAGHDVWLLVGWQVASEYQQSEFHPGVTLDIVSSGASSLRRYADAIAWIFRHRRRLGRLDILHCHLTFGSVFGTLAAGMLGLIGSGRPAVIETYHSVGMPIPRWKRWVHARLASTRDGLALMAEDEYWRAFRRAHPQQLTAVIQNGIRLFSRAELDPAAVLAFRRELGIPDRVRYVVGTVSMLRPSRRTELYVHVFRALADAFGDDIAFVIAGSGPELDRLRTSIAEHRLEGQVKLPGLVLTPELAMATMDLYVTANVERATGVAALQAASLGIPTIAIQFQDGFEASPDDWIWSSTSLEAVAAKALELLRSDAARVALGQRQSDYVREHHSLESMSAAYQSLYDEAIRRRRAVEPSPTD